MSGHAMGSKCSCCSMSRRCFLASVTTAAAASLAGGALAGTASAESRLEDHVDLGALRPRPTVRIKTAVVRMKPPYWLGWPGASYDLEGRRGEYERQFAEAAARVGVQLDSAAPLESDEAVDAFCKALQAEKPDAVLIMIQHLSYWHWADRIAKAGIPTIIFSPVGTCFTGHVVEISRRPGVHVISSLAVEPVEQAMRMVRAKRQFEASRLLVVAGEKRVDDAVLPTIGAKVRTVPRAMLQELFARMPECDEAHEVQKSMFHHAKRVVEPTRKDGVNAARSFMTAKRLMKDEESNAITTDCLGMVTAKAVPTPPCMAASMFQDAGVTYGCEADVMGALSLMLTSYLFDKPGFMNDPVPETYKNLLIAAHCVSGTKLRGFSRDHEPYILRSHSESNIGVSLQVIWEKGMPVTLARFNTPGELIIDTGTVVGNVDTPPAGGCRTSVEIQMDRVEDARDVMGFHQVVFYGNHRRDLEAFCQMYGIKPLHSPERPPERAKA